MASEAIPETPGRLHQRILRMMMVEQERPLRCVQYFEQRQNTTKFLTMELAHTLMEQKQEAINQYSGSRIFYHRISLMQES